MLKRIGRCVYARYVNTPMRSAVRRKNIHHLLKL